MNARPNNVIPKAQRLTAPRTERGGLRIRDTRPGSRRKSATKTNSSSSRRREHPRAHISKTNGAKDLGSKLRKSSNLVTPRSTPFLENPRPPTLPTSMTGSTSEGIQVLTRRIDRSIDRDSGKGVMPDPRTASNFNKPFGLHPGTQSFRSSARSPGPRRTTTFRETEMEDRRQEPSGPSDIEMEVPTEKEGPKPRTAIATPTNRRPKAGPKLFRDRPSGRSTDPAKVDLSKN